MEEMVGRRSRDGCIPWVKFKVILANFPMPTARVVRSIYAA